MNCDQQRELIVSSVATGAASGALVGSQCARSSSDLLHLAWDRLPHQDVVNRRFEIGSGVAALGMLVMQRGLLDPATIGGFAALRLISSIVVPAAPPTWKKLFPTVAGIALGPSRQPPTSSCGAILGALVPSMTAGRAARAEERSSAPLSEISGVTPGPPRCSVTARRRGPRKVAPLACPLSRCLMVAPPQRQSSHTFLRGY